MVDRPLSDTERKLSRTRGLNNRQTDAVYFALHHGSINNREYRDLAGGVSDETARKELAALVQAELLFKDGAGRLARYVLEPTLQTVEDDDPFKL
jgi:predicted HTH transcriptional regulator